MSPATEMRNSKRLVFLRAASTQGCQQSEDYRWLHTPNLICGGLESKSGLGFFLAKQRPFHSLSFTTRLKNVHAHKAILRARGDRRAVVCKGQRMHLKHFSSFRAQEKRLGQAAGPKWPLLVTPSACKAAYTRGSQRPRAHLAASRFQGGRVGCQTALWRYCYAPHPAHPRVKDVKVKRNPLLATSRDDPNLLGPLVADGNSTGERPNGHCIERPILFT